MYSSSPLTFSRLARHATRAAVPTWNGVCPPCALLGLAATPRPAACVPSARLPLMAHRSAYSTSSPSPPPHASSGPSATWRPASKARTAHGVVRKPGLFRKLAQFTVKVVRTGGQVGIVLVSIATGGLLLWAIGDDLLSTSSPNNIFSATVKRLRNVTAVTSVLGDDFKGLVEIDEDLHHWRSRQVTHSYVTDRWGRKKLALQFYLKSKSTGAMAKVTCDMGKPNGDEDSSKWVYEKLVLQCFLPDGSQKTVRVV